MQQQSPPESLDLAALVADLNGLLRLKTTVIGMKLFATVEEMEAILRPVLEEAWEKVQAESR